VASATTTTHLSDEPREFLLWPWCMIPA